MQSQPAGSIWRTHWVTAGVVAVCIAAGLLWREYQRRVRVEKLIWEAQVQGAELTLEPEPLEKLQQWKAGTPVRWKSGARLALVDSAHLDTAWLQEHDYLAELPIACLSIDEGAMSADDAAILISRHPLQTCIARGKPNADAIAAALSGSLQLEEVILSRSDLTDTGLRALPLEQLVRLHIHDTQVTSSALSELRRCRELQHIAIDGSQLDESVVIALAALPSLESVALLGRDTDDEKVQLLVPFANLPRLELVLTSVTDAGHENMRKAMPRTTITRIGHY